MSDVEILREIDPERVRDLRDRGEYFWLDLAGAGPEDLRTLSGLVPIHPLALEDTNEFGQRAKLDDYPDSALLVFYGVEPGPDGHGRVVEVHLHISRAALVTVQREPLTALAAARDRVARNPDARQEHAVYQVLDALADSFLETLDAYDDTIDGLQEALVQHATEAHRRRIFDLRRRLTHMHQAAVPQRDLLAPGDERLRAIPGLDHDHGRNRLRDIHDHLARATELIATHREQLGGLLDLYLTETSNRLNEIMKRLTVIATVFLPLTFLTGFFGMNFAWLVQGIAPMWTFLVFGLGLLTASALAVAWYLRRSAE